MTNARRKKVTIPLSTARTTSVKLPLCAGRAKDRHLVACLVVLDVLVTDGEHPAPAASIV